MKTSSTIILQISDKKVCDKSGRLLLGFGKMPRAYIDGPKEIFEIVKPGNHVEVKVCSFTKQPRILSIVKK